MINKSRNKTPPPNKSSFPGPSSFPTLLSPPPHKQGRRKGKRRCGHLITFLLCCFFLHILLPCSSVGSLPQMQFFKNCCSMYPFCSVQSFRNCFSVLSPQVTAPDSSCGIDSIYATAHFRVHPPSSGIGTGCRVDPCFPMHLHGLQGKICFSMVFTTGCREAPPSPHLGISRAVSPIFSLLSHSCCISIFTLS